MENAFVDAKQFRGIATRYCKLAAMFEGLLSLVSWFVGTRRTRRGSSPYHDESLELEPHQFAGA